MFTLIKFCQQKVCIQGVLEASFHLSLQQSFFSYIQADIQPFCTTIMKTVIINMYVYIHNFCFACKMTEWNFVFKQRYLSFPVRPSTTPGIYERERKGDQQNNLQYLQSYNRLLYANGCIELYIFICSCNVYVLEYINIFRIKKLMNAKQSPSFTQICLIMIRIFK